MSEIKENMDMSMDTLPHSSIEAIINDILKEDDDDNTEFSMWFKQGEDFVPGVDVKTEQHLPSGVYKIAFERDDYHIKTIKMSTDELYNFSESFTETILKEVEKFWDKKDVYDKYNIAHKRGLLLEGGAGCGKSSLIALLVQELIKRDGIVFIVNSPEDFHHTYYGLQGFVRKIEPNRPIITIIEDVDQLIDNMNGNDGMVLDFMDGENSISDHLIILTSNDTTELSDALLRPSRIDMRYVLTPPSDAVRTEYFKKKNIPEDQLKEFVKKTKGMSFADLKEVFISTQILDKPLDKIIDQLLNPFESKDYLSTSSKKIKI